jgi:RND superfamily putative drug exporter
MTGMFLVPDAQLRSFATGAILVGLITVAAALTLLPAVLQLAGNRIDALRVPLLGRMTSGEGRLWPWIAGHVLRRPLVSAATATALLLAAAAPVLGMQTGFAGPSSMPDELTSKQGFVALQRSFRESVTDPMQIAIAGDVSAPRVRAAITGLERRLQGDGAFGPSTRRDLPQRRFALVSVPFAGDSMSSGAYRAVERVRREYVPASFASAGATVLVGGTTAHHVDYFTNVDRWLPIVIVTVLALTFVLLTLVFRSLVLPLQAVLFNLLSVGAAYGLIVLVFVDGLGNELLGFTQVDAVDAWIPLFLFAVLFGLSMDYNVFLLSRIRERYAATGDHAGAIRFGIGSTARLITGAALIIVAVFAGFATGELVGFQQVGFGVAVALLIDATIIRSVLVPASLKLIGTRTWWLPRGLGWLPHLNPEGEHHVHGPVLRPDDGRDDLDDGRHARRAPLAAGVVRAVARQPAGDVTSV